MGTIQNKNNHDKFDNIKQKYKIIKAQQTGITYIQQKSTSKQYILKQISTNSITEYQNLERLISRKKQNIHQHVLQIKNTYFKTQNNFCSNLYKIYMIIQFPFRNLYQQIQDRKSKNYQSFSQSQLWSIIYSCSLGIKHIYSTQSKHQLLCSSRIYIDKQGMIKIGDPSLIQYQDRFIDRDSTNHFYPSPQQLQEEFIIKNRKKAIEVDIFTLGMIMLESIHLQFMDYLYDSNCTVLNRSGVEQKTRQIKTKYSLRLYDLIQKMLKFKSQQRIKIEDLIQSIQSQNFDQQDYKAQSKQMSKPLQQLQPFNLNILQGPIHTPSYWINKQQMMNKVTANKLILDEKTKYYNSSNYNNNLNTYQPYKTQSFQRNSYIPLASKQNLFTPSHFYSSNNLYHHQYHPKISNQINNLPFSNTTLNNNYINTTMPYTHNINTQFNQHIYTNSVSNNNFINSIPQKTIPNQLQNYNLNKQNIFKYQAIPPYDKKDIINSNISQPSPKFNIISNDNEKQNQIKYSFPKLNQFSNQNQINQKNNLKQKSQNNSYCLKQTQLNQTPIQKVISPISHKEQSEKDKRKQQMEARNSIKQNIMINSNLISQTFVITQQQLSKSTDNKPIQSQQIRSSVQQQSQLSLMQSINGNNQILEQEQPEQSEQPLEYVCQQYDFGSKYQGYKLKGQRHGYGKFCYQDGGYYQGQWKFNKMSGFAKLYYQNGNLAYEGNWFQDMFNGLGQVFNDNPKNLTDGFDFEDFTQLDDYWIYYKGEFKNDSKHGKGQIRLVNGEVFEGYFEEDTIKGEGKFYCLNGEVVQGIWMQNKLIKRI